jgi:PAS domain S-box-containing protein
MLTFTDRELLPQELRRREAYLAEAQSLSHTGSFGWNASTDEHFWSDETFRIFEFDPSATLSLPTILERVHPQDMASVNMAIAAANRAEGINLEFRLLMPDARIKYLHVVGKAARGETGTIEVIGAVMDITARKLTEIDLRRSKAHLADAQRLSRTGSVGMEVSTMRIFWSEEAARIYGYPPGTEPTPDLILQRSHPDDVGRLKEVLGRAAQGGSDLDFEHRLLMPDGSIKHLHNLAHCFRDEAGNEEIIGAITDITERKVAEEAIRRSEAYLAEAQRLSHTGSFGWKPDTGEIVWSDETYRIFEYDRTEKPQLDMVLERIHPQDKALAQQIVESASTSGIDFEHEYRLVMPSGAIKHIHVRAHALHDSSGNIEFVGAVTDITERKTAEEKIREQEVELRQMLDLAPQQVAVFGSDGERLYANRVALDYVGLSLDEWSQTPGECFRTDPFIHPYDQERAARAHSNSTRSGGSVYELELRVRGADGNYRWFLYRCSPLHDDKGQVKRWYVGSTDIDERKRAEERLQQENVALREEVDKASMFEEIVGASPALGSVLSRVSKVARSDSTVLITGETGTGKELVARAIHKRSSRGARPFVSVNCAAVPRDLIGSELFGHEKGAFTGATQRRLGRFELAHGGTIFLDEVGELPMETQVALLRVLQEREFERVGGSAAIRVDVRVIAATNRDLQAAIDAGTLRRDLFLSAERVSDHGAAAAPARRRHPAAHRVLHRSLRAEGGQDNPAREQTDARSPAVVSVAGERARTAERNRAVGDRL